MKHLFILMLLAVYLAGCAPSAPDATPLRPPAVAVTSLPAATLTPTLTATVTKTPNACFPCGRVAATMTAHVLETQTQQAVQTTSAAQTPLVTATDSAASCGQAETMCLPGEHLVLQRPIGLPGKQSIERSYPYGSTQGGKREPHHGVEFYNAQSTPVLAAADGTVIFAGNDKLTLLAWITGYYGNVVVIEHHIPASTKTMFTLYAHMYKIDVTAGQQVKTGEKIGEVGATGTAIGSHLHFEVREINNDYRSSRNPELWLQPLPGTGVLAGRVEDVQGNLQKSTVNFQRIENGVLDPISVASVETYVNESQPVNGDDFLHENFAVGGLAAGDYRLSLLYNGLIYEQVVTIEAGKLTTVKFVVK